MKRKVLISAPYFQPVVEQFRSKFEENQIELVIPPVKERMEEEELLKVIGNIDGVISGDDAFTENVLRAAKKLKVISKWGTGIDSIDQNLCRELGIAVRNTPNAFTDPVADTVMGYILCFARNLSAMDRKMKEGCWKKIPGVALNEKTLGIIGIGNIGRAVAKRARAFGMKVLGNDIKDIPLEIIMELGVEMVGKDRLYAEADFISLNCDLNPASRHLLNIDGFRKMKRTAYVINTARGQIINEENLVKALGEKLIAGAGLDVFEQEPIPADSPLLKMDNVILAPHNSNSSPRAWQKVHENTLANLLEELNRR